MEGWAHWNLKNLAELSGLDGFGNNGLIQTDLGKEDINLSDQPDEIVWRWTQDGTYTAKSAYRIQFQGSYCKFQPQTIWRAQAEGIHRLFTWLLLQRKEPLKQPHTLTLPEPHEGIQKWWRRSMQSTPKDKRRTAAALLMYTCWNVWNESNRRIFQGKLASPFVVFSFIKEEIRQRACGAPVIT
ncbi:hypothetical protein SETIT_9G133300v2 [Setaria italica]|uniref:Reverse transcriptase zinc-binding domain-containing protein n=1 Tax=Setaria italica TaxID=4555 RepID=A0A368SG45_SETIT|nr:hypothetical protein SETIT_9G133300v2 [Setaria italica]